MAFIYKRRSRGWHIVSWFDHAGQRRNRGTRTMDYRAAERIAAKLESDAA